MNTMFRSRLFYNSLFFGPLLAFSLVAICNSASVAQADTVYVQVKNSKLRSAPNPWSSSVANLVYGDSLEKLASDNAAWWHVKGKKGTGYIASLSVTERQVVLNSKGGSGKSSVDASDVVMAGKGFSKEVEQAYAKGGNLDYGAVNRMEALKVADSEVAKFAKDGQVGGVK